MAESSSPALPGDVEWLPGPGGAGSCASSPRRARPPALILRLAGGGERRIEARAAEYAIPGELDWSAAWLQWPDGTRAALPLPHGPHAEVIELHPRRFAANTAEKRRAATRRARRRGGTRRGRSATSPRTGALEPRRAGMRRRRRLGRSSRARHRPAAAFRRRRPARNGKRRVRSVAILAVGARTAPRPTLVRAPGRGRSTAPGATRGDLDVAPARLDDAAAAPDSTQEAEAVWRERRDDLRRELAEAADAIARARDGERSARDAVLTALAAARADLRASRAAREADASTLAAVTGELEAERAAHAVTRGSVGTLADALVDRPRGARRRQDAAREATQAELDAARAELRRRQGDRRRRARRRPPRRHPRARRGRRPCARRSRPRRAASRAPRAAARAAADLERRAREQAEVAGRGRPPRAPRSPRAAARRRLDAGRGRRLAAPRAPDLRRCAATSRHEPLAADVGRRAPTRSARDGGDARSLPANHDDRVRRRGRAASTALVSARPAIGACARALVAARPRGQRRRGGAARRPAARPGRGPRGRPHVRPDRARRRDVRGVRRGRVGAGRPPLAPAPAQRGAVPSLRRAARARRAARRRARQGPAVPPQREAVRPPQARCASSRRSRDARLSLADAVKAGARLEPALVYRALPLAIDPEWTRGHKFTVAQRIVELAPQTWHVTARDGQPLRVVERRTEARADATVTMSRAAFERMLRDEPPARGDRPQIRGDRAAVAALKRWTDLARRLTRRAALGRVARQATLARSEASGGPDSRAAQERRLRRRG